MVFVSSSLSTQHAVERVKTGLARNRENVSDISDICVSVDSCFSYAVITFELSVFVSVLLVEETGVP
jgi:hypothetical protein